MLSVGADEAIVFRVLAKSKNFRASAPIYCVARRLDIALGPFEKIKRFLGQRRSCPKLEMHRDVFPILMFVSNSEEDWDVVLQLALYLTMRCLAIEGMPFAFDEGDRHLLSYPVAPRPRPRPRPRPPRSYHSCRFGSTVPS